MKTMLILILFASIVLCQPSQRYLQAIKNKPIDGITTFKNSELVLIKIPSYLSGTRIDASINAGTFDMFLGEIKKYGYEWTGGLLSTGGGPSHFVCKPLKTCK